MSFCLDDGMELLYGPAIAALDEHATAILPRIDIPPSFKSISADMPRGFVEPQKSIAVLPFVNLSNDPDNEYFSDGLAEEILNVLAQIPEMKVTARTSCFAFRGKEQDVREIGEALDVRNILEGSVRRSGNRIRVTAQLIDATNGYHLWSDRFDRELTDVFAVQDEITAAVTGALKLTLLTSEQREYQPTLAGYEAFLKGRYMYYRFTPKDFAQAEAHFKEAVRLDPLWADPLSALADVYFISGFYGWRPSAEMIASSRSAAQAAMKLDAKQPMAHAVLGAIAALHDYDWSEAERHMLAATSCDTREGNVEFFYSIFYLLPLARYDEADSEMAQAISRDPLNKMWHGRRGWISVCSDHADDAIAHARKALDLDENDYQAVLVAAMAYCLNGKFEEGLPYALSAFELGPFDTFARGMYAGTLYRLGDKEKAAALMTDMTGALNIGMTIYHLVCGQIDEAINWFDRDIQERRANCVMIALASWARPLREHSSWPEISLRINFPEGK